HDPERGCVADLNERVAAPLNRHTDTRLSADDEAADRGAHDDSRRTPLSDRDGTSLDPCELRLGGRHLCFCRDHVTFDPHALFLHSALPLELDSDLTQ